MELISKKFPSFVGISSFFIESLNKGKSNSASSNPEKLPGKKNKTWLNFHEKIAYRNIEKIRLFVN